MKEEIDLDKKGVVNEVHKKFYLDFNHCNDLRTICSSDCEKTFTLEEVRDWCIEFTNKKLASQKKEILEEVERIPTIMWKDERKEAEPEIELVEKSLLKKHLKDKE